MAEEKVLKFPDHPDKRCHFCGKPATKLCDKVKGEIHAIDMEGPGVVTHMIHTCDKLICDDCATHIDGADFCPDCMKIIKKHLGR